MKSTQISDLIKEKAKSLGLSDCAIVPASFLAEEKEHFESWLSNEMHGEMGYMSRNVENGSIQNFWLRVLKALSSYCRITSQKKLNTTKMLLYFRNMHTAPTIILC